MENKIIETNSLTQLSVEEKVKIIGGETGWYWVTYYLGRINHAASKGGSGAYHDYNSKYKFGK